MPRLANAGALSVPAKQWAPLSIDIRPGYAKNRRLGRPALEGFRVTASATSSSEARAASDTISDPSDDRVRKVGAVLVCAVVFFLSAFADTLNGFVGVAILTAVLMVGLPRSGQSSLALIIAVTGVAIFTMPYIGLIYVGDDVQTAWFALFIIVGIVMVATGEPGRRSLVAWPSYGALDLPLIAIYLVVGLLLWGGEGLRQISFYAGWALALIHLERIYANTWSLFYRITGLLLFAAVIGFFVTVLWSGGGRIVQLSFALGPILLAVHYRLFRLNALVLGGAAAVLSFVGRLIRFGWSDGLAGLAVDSGASPITITSYLWRTKDIVLGMGSVIEQWVLLFVNWFPRDLWPGKPLGIGSTFVDLVIGREGVSAEHNLAIGFFGEHMFYLPNAWIVSVALLVIVLVAMRRLLVRVSAPYRAPVIIYDVWLITLFWGGMAAFAARVWFALIPVIPYMLLMRQIDRNATRPVDQAAAAA